jgi:DnaJ-class molecular chaperone
VSDYDNQMPPEDDTIECPDCDGTGQVDLSNCCGVEFNTDIMMCSDCHEHCDRSDCDTCNGTGQLDSKAERAKAYQEYLEKKADEARDESLLESGQKIGSDADRFLDKHIEE